jgi:hypothetical protein
LKKKSLLLQKSKKILEIHKLQNLKLEVVTKKKEKSCRDKKEMNAGDNFDEKRELVEGNNLQKKFEVRFEKGKKEVKSLKKLDFNEYKLNLGSANETSEYKLSNKMLLNLG